MPGLLRGMARTAVVAGTATAVSNRVSRRQGERWAEQDTAYAAPPRAPAPAAPDPVEQLKELARAARAGRPDRRGVRLAEGEAARLAARRCAAGTPGTASASAGTSAATAAPRTCAISPHTSRSRSARGRLDDGTGPRRRSTHVYGGRADVARLVAHGADRNRRFARSGAVCARVARRRCMALRGAGHRLRLSCNRTARDGGPPPARAPRGGGARLAVAAQLPVGDGVHASAAWRSR